MVCICVHILRLLARESTQCRLDRLPNGDGGKDVCYRFSAAEVRLRRDLTIKAGLVTCVGGEDVEVTRIHKSVVEIRVLEGLPEARHLLEGCLSRVRIVIILFRKC